MTPRKKDGLIPVMFRTKPAIKKALEQIADEQHCSLSAVVQQAIDCLLASSKAGFSPATVLGERRA